MAGLLLVRHPRPLRASGLCYGRLDLDVEPAEVQRAATLVAAQLPTDAGAGAGAGAGSGAGTCIDTGMGTSSGFGSGSGSGSGSGLGLGLGLGSGSSSGSGSGSGTGRWTLRGSPARRCRLLAEALRSHRPDLHWGGLCEGVAEMDLGAWEGRRWTDVPRAELQAWTDDFADYRAGGNGESMRQFLARVRTELHRVQTRPLDAPEIWITHAGVMRAIVWLLGSGRNGQMPAARQWPSIDIGFGEIRAVTSGISDEEDSAWSAIFTTLHEAPT